MPFLGNLSVVLNANTVGFNRNLAMSQQQLTQFGNHAEKVGRKVARVGRRMTTTLTLPIVGALGVSVKAFADFDSAMTQSLAIMDGVGPELRAEMEKTAKKAALDFAMAPKKAAESYFYLASAGLSARESIAAMPEVAAFAKAGMFDMARATDLATDAQSALGGQARNMLHVTDVLVRANTLANATVEQFSEALTNEAGPAMRQYKIQLEEGVAVLAAYADQGIKGDVAGSKFGRTIRLLTKAARDNEDAFEKYGIEVYNTEGNFRNFADIAKDMETAFDGMSVKERSAALDMLGFKARVQQAILPIIGASDKIREYKAALEEAGGTTREVAEKQMQSLSQRLMKVRVRLTLAAQEIGKVLVPVVEKIAKGISVFADALNTLDQRGKLIVVVIAAIVAAIGPLLMMFGFITIGFGAIVAHLPLIIAVTAAVYGIGKALKAVADAFDLPITELEYWSNAFKIAMIEGRYLWKRFATFFVVGIDNIVQAVFDMGNVFKTLFGWIKDNWKKVLTFSFDEIEKPKFDFTGSVYRNLVKEYAELEKQKQVEIAAAIKETFDNSLARKIEKVGGAAIQKAKDVASSVAAASEDTPSAMTRRSAERFSAAIEYGSAEAYRKSHEDKSAKDTAKNTKESAGTLQSILAVLRGDATPQEEYVIP